LRRRVWAIRRVPFDPELHCSVLTAQTVSKLVTKKLKSGDLATGRHLDAAECRGMMTQVKESQVQPSQAAKLGSFDLEIHFNTTTTTDKYQLDVY
jgi:hypothetical protein